MAYQLTSVTIRANNTAEGMERIGALWGDVASGRLPVVLDSDGRPLGGISPVARYANYQSDETGDYDLSVLGVEAGFFQELEQAVDRGLYQKYHETADDLGACAKAAWGMWEDQRSGAVKRAFTCDYESTLPAEYAKDGKAHCSLYIAIAP